MKTPYRIQFLDDHLTIERIDRKPVRCTWDVIQRIKNEMCGTEGCLREFFPAQQHVVNEINRRHFWVTNQLPPLNR